MDDEERVFRRLARRTFEDASDLVGKLWTDYSKEDRIKHYADEEFMNKLLEPSGWTFTEFKEALFRLMAGPSLP